MELDQHEINYFISHLHVDRDKWLQRLAGRNCTNRAAVERQLALVDSTLAKLEVAGTESDAR